MSKLDEELDKLFGYTSCVSAIYAKLRDQYRHLGGPYANIRFASEDLGIEGIAHHYHTDREGAVIYEYAVDREIRRTGTPLRAPFEMLLDCEHHYYGLKLNCLALLSGQRIKSLVLRDSYNGVSIPVRYNPTIAKLFLSTLTHLQEPTQEPAGISEKQQFALFQK